MAGNDTYMVYNDWQLRPREVTLTRFQATDSNADDIPTAPGVTLSDANGDLDGRPLMAFLGEPLIAMVQNLGRNDNGYASVDGTNTVLSQGFTTGSDGFGYRLQGIGVELTSGSHLPDDSASVAVAVHADSGGQPGAKLFDLRSPTEYAAGVSFFEAPPGTYLDPSTAYVLVWRHAGGTTQRLRKTQVDAEDAGARTGAVIANEFYRGADLSSLSAAQFGDALEIAVYTEVLDTAPGELVIVAPTAALVSSIAQTTVTGSANVITTSQQAQPFTTGLQGAATLDSVEVLVSSFSGDDSDVSAEIYSAVYNESATRYDPDSSLYALTNPATLGTGAQVFTAPDDATLAPDTTYFVVFSNSASSTTFNLNITLSNDEDAGGAAGWSIGDSRRISGWSSTSSTLLIRVNGRFTTRPTEVDPTWALAPDGLGDEGGVFRLLFLTSAKSAATDTDIATYNTFVQSRAAAGHEAIQAYSAGFRAVASTAAVDARDNSATTGASVPIYWLGGTKLADNYGDFYDGSWDDEQHPTDESGGANSLRAAWTGSDSDGTEQIASGVSRALGGGARVHAAFGTLGSATRGPLSGGTGWREIQRSLYGISEVFTVGPNPAVISELAITSDPGADGIYRTGDEIEVTATFGAPVAVSGRPRIKLRLGRTEQRDVWAIAGSVAPEVVDLVKNTRHDAVGSSNLRAISSKAAQGFTTGAHAGGYTLDEIGIDFSIISNTATAGAHLVVTLNADDGGNPGAALCTLSDPPTFVSLAVNVFDAPTTCPVLAPGRTYFVVVDRVEIVTADTVLIRTTTMGGEDAESAAGWSIGNSSHLFNSGPETWSSTNSSSHQILVRGAPVPLPTGDVVFPGPERALVSNVIGLQLSTSVALDSTTTKAAQAFTTGARSDGYRLSSITLIFVLDNNHLAGDDLTVTLNADSSGNPGNALCTLDDPAVFGSIGRNSFAAPTTNPCPTLTANTTYFVVIERVDVTTTHARWLNRGLNLGETGDSALGWSIGDSSHSFASGSWSETDDEPFGITVNGVTFLRASLQVPFFYTVQASDESDSDGIAVGLAAASDAVDLNGGSITLAGTDRSAVLGFRPLDSDAGHLVNWARPTLVDAISAVDGRRLHLTFSEELNPDSQPLIDLFTVYLDGGPAALSGTTAAVAGRVVTLRLETALSSSVQALTVSYRDPSAGDDRNAVEDREGNDAVAFDRRALSNRFGLKAELLPDSPLIPEGLGLGAQFRLLFLTSTTRDAISTDIETYNAFVQAAAAIGRADIRQYGTGFFAVASTAAVDARDNTGTTGPGVPIYWLGGAQIANDYADFYDGTWADEANPTDEAGAAADAVAAWTGSDSDGTEQIASGVSRALGGGARALAAYGGLDSADYDPLSGQTGWREISRPFYALSEVFTVVSPAAVSQVEISSDPGSDGNYATGDDIAVAFTFGEEVDVRGKPRIRIRLGDDASTERTAYFDSAVLVKNTAQAPFSGSPLNAATPKFAQRFTTGAIPGGYQLSEIGIRFHTIEDPASAGGQLTVTVNRDNSGEPGSVRCTLTNPSSLRSNVLSTFVASGCALSVETDYYVVIERTSFSDDTIAVWTTASADEDASRLEDWLLADSGHVYRTSRGSWNAGGAPFVIKVGGELS